jgi:hypothetical protein
VLPRTIRLFKDNDVQVRGVVVESLACIGASLPARVTEAEVWPLVEHLLEPTENARIHATAMRTLAHILQNQREKGATGRLFREQLPPVFTKIASFARRHAAEDQRLVDDDTYMLLEVASEVFGQFVYSLSLFARRSFMKEAYKAYCQMATCNGPIIRRNCAFNLPGVAKALGERFAIELSGLCEFLAKDMDEEVRFILAAGIHQSATLLVPRGNYDRLFGAVCALLEDDNPHVRMNALENFHELLSAFVRDGSDPASIRRLAPVFMNLSVLSEGNWRIQKRLAEQLDKCAEIIPPDALIENVLPLLYRLTEQGTPLVRYASMHATARALRNIPSIPDRNLAISQFWEKAIEGPFWMRLALLDGGAAALCIFSSTLFVERFAPTLLRLADDRVANVRIRCAQMLRDLAPLCARLTEYTRAVDRLRADSDPDVVKVMAGHDKGVEIAIRRARENSAQDQARLREEQEFYGIIPRTTKRVRGHRLNPMRTGRILSNHRRQGTEYSDLSSGQLSVSQAVISAAKANSAVLANGSDAPPNTVAVPVIPPVSAEHELSSGAAVGANSLRLRDAPAVPAEVKLVVDGPPSAGATCYDPKDTEEERLRPLRRQTIGIDDELEVEDNLLDFEKTVADGSSAKTVASGSSVKGATDGRSSISLSGRNYVNKGDVLTMKVTSREDVHFSSVGSTTAPAMPSASGPNVGPGDEHAATVRGRNGHKSAVPTEPVSLTSLPSARTVLFADNEAKSMGQLSESGPRDSRSSSGSGSLAKHFVRGSVAVRTQRGSGNLSRVADGRAKSWTELFGKKSSSEAAGNVSPRGSLNETELIHRNGETNGRVTAARAKSYLSDTIPSDSPLGSLQAPSASRKKTKKKKKKRPSLPSHPSMESSVDALDIGPSSVVATITSGRIDAGGADGPLSRPPLQPKSSAPAGAVSREEYARSSAPQNAVCTPGTPRANGTPELTHHMLNEGTPRTSSPKSQVMYMQYSVDGERTGNTRPVDVARHSGDVAQVPSSRSKSMAVDSTRIYEQDVVGRGQDNSLPRPMDSSALDLAGRSVSVDGRAPGPGFVSVNMGIDVDTGLPSFRGTAPWARKPGAAVVRHPDGKRIALEELARSSPTPRSTSTRHRGNAGNVPSFHSEQVVLGKVPSQTAATNVLTDSNMTSQTVQSSPSGAGFLKSLFGRKKR